MSEIRDGSGSLRSSRSLPPSHPLSPPFPSQAVATVFEEVLENIVELMVDPFGNYLVQKLLDRCSEQQRLEV